MKIGVCTKFENINDAAAAGFDYLECNLSKLAQLPEEAFDALYAESASFPIPVLRANGFIPGTIKVTGNDVNPTEIREYLDTALSRASKIGVKTAVFGSGGARNVPEGFPVDAAYRQLISFLKEAASYAEKYGVVIAIEPLRASECNIINYVSEATILAAVIDSPFVTVLADSFHMICGHEPFDAMVRAGSLLKHVHISHPLSDLSGRDFPREGDGEDYSAFIRKLREAGYAGTVSVEAGTKNFRHDAAEAANLLRKLINNEN
ncbi:MAG: sugar phosphate isomerase/epimerase [Clostridia bacterium]|nr:sugar phosphate isomerase/epimerase [Clostridia bacterium]